MAAIDPWGSADPSTRPLARSLLAPALPAVLGVGAFDLWCIFVDLACITVEAAQFDRYALDRLTRTARDYR